ncbi:MAG: ATP-dependent Clp protease proteolytic subunit [Candidatus Sumerlaeales bacterium]|nr:ATP-dependent Clp protease proteolytic subunit [Candidatus Sumerlaeales bacterium]
MTKQLGGDPDFVVVIPESVENLMLPSPELVSFYRDLGSRTIWIDNDISIDSLDIEKYIIQFNRADKDVPVEFRVPIKLLFFTNGGDVDVHRSLIAVIEQSKTPVIGVNMGVAHSAGCYIFLACHKRLAMPRSVFLIHQGGTEGMSGTFDQVDKTMTEYKRLITEITDYVKSRTSIPHDMLAERIKTEWYLNADEAIKYGVCEKIVDNIDEIL